MENPNKQMQDRIDRYWSKRAEEFSRVRFLELASPQRTAWTRLIAAHLPQRQEPVRALDTGTGAGFYAFLLAELGCRTTGIDYSESMIREAKANAELLQYPEITFRQMDAQNMDFPDGSFDFIISRNVTWTVPEPEKVYAQWYRLLTPGGVLLNFDANYGSMFRRADETGETERQNASWEPGRICAVGTRPDMIRERNDIAVQLSVADRIRPQWDLDRMLQLGFRQVSADMDFRRDFPGGKQQQAPASPGEPDRRMFMVKGIR